MGDIFINSKHVYEVTLLNKGDIAANWALQAPPTPFAKKFRFGPMQGTLDVKDRCAHRIHPRIWRPLFVDFGYLLHPGFLLQIGSCLVSAPLCILAVHLDYVESLRWHSFLSIPSSVDFLPLLERGFSPSRHLLPPLIRKSIRCPQCFDAPADKRDRDNGVRVGHPRGVLGVFPVCPQGKRGARPLPVQGARGEPTLRLPLPSDMKDQPLKRINHAYNLWRARSEDLFAFHCCNRKLEPFGSGCSPVDGCCVRYDHAKPVHIQPLSVPCSLAPCLPVLRGTRLARRSTSTWRRWTSGRSATTAP